MKQRNLLTGPVTVCYPDPRLPLTLLQTLDFQLLEVL